CRKEPDTNQLLPSGFRAREETPYLTGLTPGVNDSDHLTIACRVTREVTGQPQSGVRVRFGFGNAPSGGGHELHGGVRPQGSWSSTVVPTDSDGWARSVYTAPTVGGTTQIVMTAEGEEAGRANMETKVPNLQRLQQPAANDGYVLVGSSESGNHYHPDGHYGTATANNGLRQIAAEYRDTAFPQAQFPNGQPADWRLFYNDQSLVWGGKFDVTPNFSQGAPPNWLNRQHDEHRVGINCDVSIRNVPDANVVINGQVQNRRSALEAIFFRGGSSRTLREFCLNHWHLRFEGGNQNNIEGPTNPNCNQRAAGSTPVDGIAASIPGAVQAENYDSTGPDGTSGSFVPDDGSSPADIIAYNYPQVLPVPGAEENGYVPTVGGQWMSYTVNVASSGYYTFTARVASASTWNTFHVEVNGVDVTGPVYIPNTGSGEIYQFVSVNNIPLEGGQRTLSVVIDGSGPDKGNFDYFTIDPYYPPQICDPEWWEIQDCQNSGGSWDYGLCGCVYYGCYNRQCEVY
ncbi:MAG TPA: carbohydrate-binding protein, partial [Pyrinomonadaceae bacterium]|nr:carbohydrate-binding protein [Pyrinomonadaceae bacterium]